MHPYVVEGRKQGLNQVRAESIGHQRSDSAFANRAQALDDHEPGFCLSAGCHPGPGYLCADHIAPLSQ
jgi:hypothetical protein